MRARTTRNVLATWSFRSSTCSGIAGHASVRDVLEALPTPKPIYTTVLTMMRLMNEKGYLDRHERGRAHVYTGPPA